MKGNGREEKGREWKRSIMGPLSRLSGVRFWYDANLFSRGFLLCLLGSGSVNLGFCPLYGIILRFVQLVDKSVCWMLLKGISIGCLTWTVFSKTKMQLLLIKEFEIHPKSTFPNARP